MNISLPVLAALACVAAASAAACSSTGGAAPGSSSAAQDLTAGDAPTTAVEVLRRGGTFMFALDESDPASRFRAQCARENADAAQASACYARIQDEGRQEGLRFAPSADGQIVFTSFGPKPGGEEIYLQFPITVAAQGKTTVVARQVGSIVGSQPHPATYSHVAEFDVVDANTIVQHDAEKGKLVFHRVD
jgi:hypothetical protein